MNVSWNRNMTSIWLWYLSNIFWTQNPNFGHFKCPVAKSSKVLIVLMPLEMKRLTIPHLKALDSQGPMQHRCSGCICTRWNLATGAMHPSWNNRESQVTLNHILIWKLKSWFWCKRGSAPNYAPPVLWNPCICPLHNVLDPLISTQFWKSEHK